MQGHIYLPISPYRYLHVSMYTDIYTHIYETYNEFREYILSKRSQIQKAVYTIWFHSYDVPEMTMLWIQNGSVLC